MIHRFGVKRRRNATADGYGNDAVNFERLGT